MSMEIDGQEVESPLVFEEIHPLDIIRLPLAARRLLDALDRMYGRQNLSLNVRDAIAEVRVLVEYHEQNRPAA